jgi:hypothetical protein
MSVSPAAYHVASLKGEEKRGQWLIDGRLAQGVHDLTGDRKRRIDTFGGNLSDRAGAIPIQLAFQLLHFRVFRHGSLLSAVPMKGNGA